MTGMYVAVILVCIGVVSSGWLNDPCSLKPSWWGQDAATDTGIKDVTANISCTNGTLIWSYPRGRLRLHFNNPQPGRQFRVCLSGNMMSAFRSVMDISGAHPSNMNVEQGQQLCSSFQSTRVSIMVESPEMFMYMTLAYYEIEFSSNSIYYQQNTHKYTYYGK